MASNRHQGRPARSHGVATLAQDDARKQREQRGETPPSSLSVGIAGRTAPTNWADYEFGPYEKFPNQQQMVMDGYLMQRYDPTIGSALSVLRMLVNSNLGKYEHENETIRDFVREDFAKLYGGPRRTVGSLLSCLWSGFAVAERRWVADNNSWHIEALDLLHPLTFFPRLGGSKCGIELDPKEKRVTQVVQQPWEVGEEPLVLKASEVVYWPFMQQLREEVLGKRLTDRARRSWFMRVKLERFWGVFLERFAHPTPVATVPKGQQVRDGEIIENAEAYADFLSNLAPGKCVAVALSADDKAIWSLDNTLGSTVGSDMAYRRACDYYNAELWKSVLMSPLLLEEPAHGSRAQASTVLELTALLVEAIQEELGSVLVDQFARLLVDYNFGQGVEDYGEWRFDPLQKDDLDLLSTVVERVMRSGAIPPTEADEASLREKFSEAGFVSAEEVAEAEAALTPEQRAARESKQLALPVGYGM